MRIHSDLAGANAMGMRFYLRFEIAMSLAGSWGRGGDIAGKEIRQARTEIEQ